jgi:hypothetical protein
MLILYLIYGCTKVHIYHFHIIDHNEDSYEAYQHKYQALNGELISMDLPKEMKK